MGLEFLKAFKPDGDALLRLMLTLVDDATLKFIANEDPIGGDARRARHINALRNIHDGGPLMKQSDFASFDEFYDQDVTELLRFSFTSDPDTDRRFIPERRGTRGHWPRAFASVVYLRALGDKKTRRGDAYSNYPVRQLAESIRRLKPWRWEISCVGKTNAIARSWINFPTMSTANRAGIKALRSSLENLQHA